MISDEIEFIRSVLEYNPETGSMLWKKRTGSKQPGQQAGYKKKDGYWYIHVNKRHVTLHRVAWVIYYGEWPDQIDHINMDRADNRIANLRNASVAENNRNRTKQSNNTSGYKGVTFNKASGKYQAKIQHNKKPYCLGYFDTAIEASLAYKKAAEELHNEFARY